MSCSPQTALLWDRDRYFTPQSEADYDLLIRQGGLGKGDSESAFVQNAVEAYLKQSDSSEINTTRARRCRQQLVNDAKMGGLFGLGAEKAFELRNHPTPGKELWKRKRKNSGIVNI